MKADFKAHRYEGGVGLLAIDPSALYEVFVASTASPENQDVDGATLITVRGPLDQHSSRWCDSYEAITQRVAEACDRPAPAIVLLLDSPGGEAAGCIEAAREIRAMCDAAGKSLFAFVEHRAASAGYALASAAREIILADTAIVGSIGILQTRSDYSQMNAARGVNFAFIASGNRKAFGNPDAPLTEAEIKDTQSLVDSVASVFFELVAEMRGTDAEAIAKLEAGVFHGQAAISAGLADAVMPLKTALASIARTRGMTAMADGDKKDKDKKESGFDAARAALESLAKGDDANAKRAKLALAALEAEGEAGDGDKKTEAGGDDQKAEGGDDDQKAEGGDTDGDKDGDKKEDKTEAAMRIAVRAERRAQKLEAQLKARDDDAERAKLIDAHPGLSASMVALLKKSPLPLVRETLAEIDAEVDGDGDGDAPKPAAAKGVTARAALAASAPKVKPTQATKSTADSASSRLGAKEKADLDRRCGLQAETALGVRESDYRLELGVIGPAPKKPAGQADGAA